jgi:hypothetical protein
MIQKPEKTRTKIIVKASSSNIVSFPEKRRIMRRNIQV